MIGPAKNRLHDYEAGWLTLLITMGVASKDQAQAAMNRVAQAIDDQESRGERRKRDGRRRKPPEWHAVAEWQVAGWRRPPRRRQPYSYTAPYVVSLKRGRSLRKSFGTGTGSNPRRPMHLPRQAAGELDANCFSRSICALVSQRD